MSNDIKGYFPNDEQGRPAAVLFGFIDDIAGGHYVPVKVDQTTGAVLVDVGGGGSAPSFRPAAGPSDEALIDGQRRVVTVIDAPLPSGSNTVGQFVKTHQAPVFQMMHTGISAPDTVIPAVQQGISFVGFNKLVVAMDIPPGGTLQLLPLIWNTALGKYVKGEVSPVFTDSEEVIVDIQSPPDYYLLPVVVTGGPISVAVGGFSE